MARSLSMSSGQRDHHRPGPAVAGGVKGARHDFRDARGVVDFGRPFGDGAEHRAVIEFLERLAVAHVRAPTWPTNTIIGVESWRAIWMPAEALVAPGPRVTKQMPGRPVALPTASAMMAAPLSCRQTVSVMLLIVKRIERRQIAFARHAEHMAHAVDRQLVDQDFAAGPRRRHSIACCKAPKFQAVPAINDHGAAASGIEAWLSCVLVGGRANASDRSNSYRRALPRSNRRPSAFFLAMNSAAGVSKIVINWRSEKTIISAPLNGIAPYHSLRGQEKYGETSVARSKQVEGPVGEDRDEDEAAERNERLEGFLEARALEHQRHEIDREMLVDAPNLGAAA